MTLMEFFGCTFISFGPPLALFIFTIAKDPLRVIMLMASAFFWLLSLLLSSLLWFAVVPLRDQLAFGLVFSVLFQELFRFLYYMILKKADEGLQKMIQQDPSEQGRSMVKNKTLMAYVCGLGFGIVSGAFSLVNVLADSTGPGTVGILGHSNHFFITSAFLTLAFIFLHTFWGIIFFAGLDKKNYFHVAAVVLSHMLISCLTLLNQGTEPVYAATLVPAYIMLLLTGGWTYHLAGGSLQNIKSFFVGKTQNYNM